MRFQPHGCKVKHDPLAPISGDRPRAVAVVRVIAGVSVIRTVFRGVFTFWYVYGVIPWTAGGAMGLARDAFPADRVHSGPVQFEAQVGE